MLYGPEVAVCSEINAEQIQCWQNIQILNVKIVRAQNQ